MHRLYVVTAVFAVIAMLFSGVAAAGDVNISDAWAPATDDVEKPGAVFMTITNTGGDDAVVGIATPAAEIAQIHNIKMRGDHERMRRMRQLEVPADNSVTLTHGDTHVMLVKLTKPLSAGDQFPVTVEFEKAGPVTAQVSVRPGMGH